MVQTENFLDAFMHRMLGLNRFTLWLQKHRIQQREAMGVAQAGKGGERTHVTKRFVPSKPQPHRAVTEEVFLQGFTAN